LTYDCALSRYELHVVLERKKQDPVGNELAPRVVALDPGVRTFLTGYSPHDGRVTEFGAQDIQRLCLLTHHIDKAIRHKQRLRMRKARLKMFRRVRGLTDQAHWQCAHHLCSRYDVILLPEFGVQKMVSKRDPVTGGWTRNIGKKTCRRMLLWSHYKFKMRLFEKAKQWGKTVVIVNEAYTSKTCSGCGWLNHNLGSSKRFECRKCCLRKDRDLNAARNILLKNT
jgi:putative transposase